MIRKWDGHTHTQFCRHGSAEVLDAYLDRAVALGFEGYTVTEHPPLPKDWLRDQRVMDELAMPLEELQQYFDHAWHRKDMRQGQLSVSIGLELDYLYGQESFTLAMVEKWQDRIEDAIVSVHYLPGIDGMRCVDLSSSDFADGLIRYYGTMEKVVDEYYNHVELAIEFAAKLPMRRRVGHINLIEKFRRDLPEIDPNQSTRRIERILQKLAGSSVGVDVNTAGLRKESCGRTYVPEWFVKACLDRNIECVYGSDAHQPADVGKGWDWVETVARSTDS